MDKASATQCKRFFLNKKNINDTMQTITEIIKDLSLDIDCLIDEPGEATERDLIKIMDRITELENQ